jgi:hypothetical protein
MIYHYFKIRHEFDVFIMLFTFLFTFLPNFGLQTATGRLHDF